MARDVTSNPSDRVEHVGRSGIYPASGPLPAHPAPVRGQGELAHPEERKRARPGWAQWPGQAGLLAAGRAIFGGYFVYNGINHFQNRQMLAQYAGAKHVPLPRAAVVGSGALILLGGLSLIAGVRPKVGASLIATFLLGVSLRMHDFWEVQDEKERSDQFINFTKNIGLLGGACLAAALPEPWPWSLPARVSAGSMASSRALVPIRQ